MKTSQAILYHYKFSNQHPIIFDVHTHTKRPQPIYDMHLSPEIGIVLEGKMKRYSGDASFDLPRGGIWLSGMLEPHGRDAILNQSKVAVFIVSPDLFAKTIIPGVDDSIWHKPFSTPAEQRPIMIDERFALIAERLVEDLKVDLPQNLINLRLQTALLEIMYLVNLIGSFNVSPPGKKDGLRRLQPAIELIYNSSQPISTEEAAQHCKLSTSRFSQLFVHATGQSFSKFSLRYRLSRVALELKQHHCPLDELADKWGFANKSHLSHRFKEHYNMPPISFSKNTTQS